MTMGFRYLNFWVKRHLLLARWFVCGAPSVKQVMELRPKLMTDKAVSLCKERGAGHWVNVVMVTGGETRQVSDTYYRVRDKSAQFQKRSSVALEPRFP